MILDEIISHKKNEVDELKFRFPVKRLVKAIREMADREPTRNFKHAIGEPRGTHIIAEIKKASPSHGIICQNFNPLKLAEIYETGGAKAISILTETKYFLGRPSYLKTVRKVTNLPILRKDFIIEPYQVYESRVLSADAILLIAMILTHQEMKELHQLAKSLGMDTLIEIHSDEDLEKALEADADIIGINNRNLKTLETNLSSGENLLKKIPKGKTIVIESGIKKREEIEYFKSLDIHAFLIGTSLLKAENILEKLKKLVGKNA